MLEESTERMTGNIKFFDVNNNFGFIILDSDGTDIFVHYEELKKAKITKA